MLIATTPTHARRARRAIALAILLTLGLPAAAAAQLDPMLGLKRVPPNVVVVVDTSFRMLEDGAGNYYDPLTYSRAADTNAAAAMGVTSGTNYRRIFQGLTFENVQDSNTKYETTTIVGIADNLAGYSTFWTGTRLEMAKAGLATAMGRNDQIVRWGLVRLRQSSPAWRTAAGCDKPVRVTGNTTLSSGPGDSSPCSGGGLGLGGKYVISAPSVAAANFSLESGGNPVLVAVPTANVATSNSGMLQLVQRPIQDALGLIPAGRDTRTYEDRPIAHALDDARAQVVTTMGADSAVCACRNSVVVLITSGTDEGDTAYLAAHDAVATAGTFAAVSGGGQTRRVPIVVIGVKPDPADEADLLAIATASGGRYFRAESSREVALAVNYAVQIGFQNPAEFDALSSSEFTYVSPIVGTVNLDGAQSATGSALPYTSITSTEGPTTGEAVPQRSNVLLTAGFGLRPLVQPAAGDYYSQMGFDGRLRAFRAFKPEPDTTRPTGWRFEQDGTRLWPDLDGRAYLAGLARAPKCSTAECLERNIYTFIPDGSGGGTVVAFTSAQAVTLAPHLGGADPTTLVPFIRSQPIGAIVGSTPAIMDPPSLDPPPDADYGYADSIGTFAADHKDRRAMIFFGANDGMVHAVDARTGYEVWAFIPYNLLPKLQTLVTGQPVEQFNYFVDSSPKIAEVKIGGQWKTMLIIGQAYGGTFYQAFDVTEAGMGVPPDQDGLTAVSALLAEFDTPNESIAFEWSFPNYSSFDPNIRADISLSDGFPGNKVRVYGDLKTSATDAEKRVGYTFSDPAVGALRTDRSVNAVITGSGYFPDIETNVALVGRAATPSIRAGHALFVLNAATGLPLGNAAGACAGTGCLDLGDISNGRKNTLQADITASGDAGSSIVTRAYAGDSDGRYWRFALADTGAISSTLLHNAGQPIYSSSALLNVGSSQRYLFFSTGSDLLAATTPGGGSPNPGTAFRLLGVRDGVSGGTVTVSRDLSPKVLSTSNLTTNGERPTSAPTVAGDIVFFTTTTDSSSASCTSATTKVYAFTYLGTAAYDSNGNGKLDNNESPVVATAVGRATAPFIVDQHLYVSTSSMLGPGVTVLGDAEDFNNGVGQVGVRILSWREIR